MLRSTRKLIIHLFDFQLYVIIKTHLKLMSIYNAPAKVSKKQKHDKNRPSEGITIKFSVSHGPQPSKKLSKHIEKWPKNGIQIHIKVTKKKWPRKNSLTWRPPKKCSPIPKNDDNSIWAKIHSIQKVAKDSVMDQIHFNIFNMVHHFNLNFISTEHAFACTTNTSDVKWLTLLTILYIFRISKERDSPEIINLHTCQLFFAVKALIVAHKL